MEASHTHERIIIDQRDPKSYITGEEYRKHYADDVPVFEREVMLDLQRQLDEQLPDLTITAFNGSTRKYNMDHLRSWIFDPEETVARPSFCPIQHLLETDGGRYPISVLSTRYPGFGPDEANRTVEKTMETHHRYAKLWQESHTHSQFASQLQAMNLPRISKIIAFGLGPLLAASTEGSRSYHTQHALMETLREHLQARQPGVSIKIICQDPAYDNVSTDVLSKLDMTTAEDPATFLEINDESFVYTVSSNIAVRQVTADMPRPAAIICNTVPPTLEGDLEKERIRMKRDIGNFENNKEHFVRIYGGKPTVKVVDGEVITMPLCTDPSSRRVRAMIQEYDVWQFPEDENFGDVSLYVRRQN